jgi:hypothetical protein
MSRGYQSIWNKIGDSYMKDSNWQPPNTKPHHPGVYMTKTTPNGTPLYQHWNGIFWGYFSGSFHGAKAQAAWESSNQNPIWKGVINE